jgi:hypothetical protein
MTTVDNLLIKIVNFSSPSIEEKIPTRDSRVLRSLVSSLSNKLFVTENQSKLLIKILRENCEKLSDFSEDIKTALVNPTWSHPFRYIEQIKKVYIVKNHDGDSSIILETNYVSETRKILQDIEKKCEGVQTLLPGKKFVVDLTEKNIVTVVDTLLPLEFEIDEKIQDYYDTIKSWSKPDVQAQFLISNIEHKNFQKHITDDLGIETSINRNIIHDRSVRYQYFTETEKTAGETLTEVIANRQKTRIYVDKKQHTVSDIMKSLIELRRFPLLVVFDTFVNSKYLENLQILSAALEDNGITDKIGIYFRLPNDDIGLQFNQLIKDKNYNSNLDADTKVAVVMSGKLPKFFLKNAWQPMSVLSLDTKMGLRHGKTSVYSNCCDCIVEWSDEPVTMEIKAVLK